MKMFRKRLIPEEWIELKGDKVIYQDENRIITQWKTLKPREDFSYGYSCYYLKEGYKVSKFIKENGELKCWYCDIITAEWKEQEVSWIFTDLLADVIIKKDGIVQVVDLDELADAFEAGMLTAEELIRALRSLNQLLFVIESGEFQNMTFWIEQTVEHA